jgi:hypothetical protein
LAGECLDVLIEPSNLVLDMSAQEGLYAVIGELRSELLNSTRGIAQEASEGPAHAGLRPGAFEQDAVEDFNLIKMVPPCCKELPPLVDSCFHNRIVIRRERYVGAVRFEEVLVNMEAWAKGFQRRLQTLHRILLLRAVKTFVVHTGNTENHT